MSQISGTQTGTNGDDIVSGSILDFNVTVDTTGAGITQANVFPGAGNDTIFGQALITAESGREVTVTGIGISDTVAFADTGTDTFRAVGAGDGFLVGTGIGLGVARSRLFGSDDADIFLIEATGRSNEQAMSTAAVESRLSGGSGDDSFTLSADVSASVDTGTDRLRSAEGAGLDNSRIIGGSGKDSVDLSVDISLDPFAPDFGAADTTATAIGAKRGSVITVGDDNSTIDVDVVATANTAVSEGLNAAQIFGGKGGDLINIESTATGFGLATAAALTNGSRLVSRAGDDQITLTGSAFAGGPPLSQSAAAFGVQGSRIKTGNGSDRLTISVNGGSTVVSEGIAVDDSIISTGADDDVITIDAFGSGNFPATGIGLRDSVVDAGGGDDNIVVTARATGEDSISGRSFGAVNSRVLGGDGNDAIRVRATIPNQGLDIDEDTVLAGGKGDDTIDAGIGNGRIKGGAGTDTAVLDYLGDPSFGFGTVSLGLVGDRVEITGNFNNGFRTVDPWKQTIFGVENFVVDDVTYTAAELVATFG